MAYALTVNWRCKPGVEEQLKEAAREFAPLARGEEGCLFYQVHTDPDDPGSIFIYELYRDEAAFQEHLSTSHFDRLVKNKMLPLLETRDRHFYVTL